MYAVHAPKQGSCQWLPRHSSEAGSSRLELLVKRACEVYCISGGPLEIMTTYYTWFYSLIPSEAQNIKRSRRRAHQKLMDAPEYPSRREMVPILVSLALGTFLFSIDTTIISVAIPSITRDFHVLDQIGWYGSAYLLVATAFQPIMSNLYRFYHLKLVYLVTVVIFAVLATPLAT